MFCGFGGVSRKVSAYVAEVVKTFGHSRSSLSARSVATVLLPTFGILSFYQPRPMTIFCAGILPRHFAPG